MCIDVFLKGSGLHSFILRITYSVLRVTYNVYNITGCTSGASQEEEERYTLLAAKSG